LREVKLLRHMNHENVSHLSFTTMCFLVINLCGSHAHT
jgi:hypothetical protein